jgi:hypothetical protein
MAFNAKRLRVVLPNGEASGGDKRRVLPVALDLDMITDEVTACWGAAQVMVTGGWCWSDTCVDWTSDPVMTVVVSADALPSLREALEAQLAEIDRAQEALSRRQAES